jgi:[acyl-carrier-protein] S-malonyltransferase
LRFLLSEVLDSRALPRLSSKQRSTIRKVAENSLHPNRSTCRKILAIFRLPAFQPAVRLGLPGRVALDFAGRAVAHPREFEGSRRKGGIMAVAFTFPGQGSQAVGMGKALADAYPEARAVFDEVDEALGEKLSAVIWDGPEEALTLTANAQPALMAVSMAVVRVLEARGLVVADRVAYVAGHSLGEYSALCAAGTFSVGDAARLLRIRGNAMQEAVPAGEGAMAAVMGLDQPLLEAACQEASASGPCQIANDNGGGQIVISGARAAVESAAALAGGRGAKRVVMLSVSAPFHSSLMQPAAEAMRAALAEVKMADPVVPLISNVRARPVSDATTIAALLVEQVTGRVRWRESIEWLAANGIDAFHELGAGKVLTGLARRIAREATGMAVGTPDDVAGCLAALGL